MIRCCLASAAAAADVETSGPTARQATLPWDRKCVRARECDKERGKGLEEREGAVGGKRSAKCTTDALMPTAKASRKERLQEWAEGEREARERESSGDSERLRRRRCRWSNSHTHTQTHMSCLCVRASGNGKDVCRVSVCVSTSLFRLFPSSLSFLHTHTHTHTHPLVIPSLAVSRCQCLCCDCKAGSRAEAADQTCRLVDQSSAVVGRTQLQICSSFCTQKQRTSYLSLLPMRSCASCCSLCRVVRVCTQQQPMFADSILVLPFSREPLLSSKSAVVRDCSRTSNLIRDDNCQPTPTGKV